MSLSARARTHRHLPTAAALRTDEISTTLLGDFTVSVNGAAIDAARWKFKHPRLLWQMLCLAPGHRLSRDEAAEALWPQAAVRASSNRLYHALHMLRSIFGDSARSDARQFVQLQGGTLRLDANVWLDVDVQRFRQAVHSARAHNGSDAAMAFLAAAQALHRDVLALPPGAEDWFAPHCQALLRDQVWVLEQLTHRHRAAGRVEQARQACQALVRVEPSNETAHRLLIEIHGAEGRLDLAAQQYAACCEHLRSGLGIEPSAATRQLMEDLAAQARQRSQQEQSTADKPGPSVLPRFAAPPRATPLLGREVELRELQRWLLEDGSARLITVVAAGGIGKTRLAAALAEQVQDAFADGVCFVAMSESQRPLHLAETVCRALALSSQERPADEVLAAALSDKHLLLVLDRFEHLIDAAPQLAQWLQAAPRLRIVVTSQCPLRSRAERVFELQPLPVHAPHAAIELFVRTARRVGVETGDPKNENVIRSACERVGGNTLAIELAAAQLANVPLAELSSALLHPLALLVAAAPDNEPQHTSLQATIGWSVSLLTPEAARLLAMTSVFAGDFSVDDAQAVLAPVLETEGLQPLLRTLLERHLLFRRGDAAGGSSGLFALTDAVREHVRGIAASLPLWPRVQAAHVQHFASLTEQLYEEANKNRHPKTVAVFLASANDIEQALQHARRSAQTRTYLRACWQFASLQIDFGAIRRAIRQLEEATAVRVHERDERDQSAWCYYMLGCALGFCGDNEAAMKQLRLARPLASGSSDQWLHMRLAHRLAHGWFLQLQVDKALKAVEKLLRLSEQLGYERGLGGYYLLKSVCLDYQAHHERAVEAAHSALRCAHRRDTPRGALIVLLTLGNLETTRGGLDLAEQYLHEAQALHPTAYTALRTFDLHLLKGVLAFERTSFDDSDRLFENAIRACQPALSNCTQVVALWRDFVSMETGREAEAHGLLRLSDQEFALHGDYFVHYLRAWLYRLQLQVMHSDWSAVSASAALVLGFVKRTNNALWASWLAESAALAAHGIGQSALALRLLGQSRALQAQAGVMATPRQVASWARTQARLCDTPVLTEGHERMTLAQQLAALSHDLSAGGGSADVSVTPRTLRGKT